MTKGSESEKKRENKFQKEVIDDLKEMFPGAIVTKLDSSHIQGIPDLLILNNEKWATLEVKRSETARKRPNQEYYVNKMNDMSFSRIIFPENKKEVFDELQQTFES